MVMVMYIAPACSSACTTSARYNTKPPSAKTAREVPPIGTCEDGRQPPMSLTQWLSRNVDREATFDGIELYLPQLAHMIIHFDGDWPNGVLESFALVVAQHSVRVAASRASRRRVSRRRASRRPAARPRACRRRRRRAAAVAAAAARAARRAARPRSPRPAASATR